MKLGLRLVAAAVATVGLAGVAYAGGKLVTGLEAPSPVLGHPIKYNVYLPQDPMPDGETFPVAYLLHGWGGDADQWWQGGPLVEMFDAAIAAGDMRPMIVVTPNGEDSWYIDNPAGKGNYATAFATDLIAEIDSKYPTKACREGRIIGGYSMGGVGAAVIGLKHPDVYAGVISLAGRFPPLLDNPTPDQLARYRGDFAGAFGDPLDPELFNAWNALSLIDDAAKARRKPRFHFVTGDNDDPDMVEGAAIVYDRLSMKAFNADFRVVEGYHNSDVWNPGVMDGFKSFAKSLPKGCPEP